MCGSPETSVRTTGQAASSATASRPQDTHQPEQRWPPATERADRLLGPPESLHTASGAPLPPAERADYEKRLAAVRASLGDAAWASLWAEGHEMTLAQAVALALSEGPSA